MTALRTAKAFEKREAMAKKAKEEKDADKAKNDKVLDSFIDGTETFQRLSTSVAEMVAIKRQRALAQFAAVGGGGGIAIGAGAGAGGGGGSGGGGGGGVHSGGGSRHQSRAAGAAGGGAGVCAPGEGEGHDAGDGLSCAFCSETRKPIYRFCTHCKAKFSMSSFFSGTI